MFATLAITPIQAMTFGLLTLPITVWIVYTDVTDMKIKNGAVLATLAVFVLAGAAVLPLEAYAWRYAHLGIALAIGFLMSLTTGMGAGDAKYIAVTAPLIPTADLGEIAVIYVAWSVVLILGMSVARRSAALRMAAPGWVWFAEERRRHIPFGLTLAPTATTYFYLGAVG